jgi:hypothetical protein
MGNLWEFLWRTVILSCFKGARSGRYCIHIWLDESTGNGGNFWKSSKVFSPFRIRCPNIPDLFARYAIHFTSYAAEGRLYVPWLRTELLRKGGVEFKQDKLESIQQVCFMEIWKKNPQLSIRFS